MTRRHSIIVALAALLAALTIAIAVARIRAASPAGSTDPILVLVSLDGWRWDYIDRPAARNLRALASRGVRVRELVPSFPVLTFPNHYTIVTGLYPEHHGIVANRMLDPATGERFALSSPAVKDGRWWGGDPLWVTVVRGGRRAGAMFWPGTEAAIGGVRPTYWKPFDGALPAEARVDQVLEWLALPEDQRPSFITLYLDDVDHAGHDFGPDSPEMTRAMTKLDEGVGRVTDSIDRLGLRDRVTLVVVSDHGMTSLSEKRIIWLEDYIDLASVEVIEWDALLELTPKSSSVDEVYRRLRRAPHLRVFTRETMPARLHYRENRRIPPIVGIPDEGWIVTSRARRRQRIDEGRAPPAGTHGFDPANRSMHATFVAAGPGIRQGLVSSTLANVHVYDFLCAVLHVTPAPNDGDPALTRQFFDVH